MSSLVKSAFWLILVTMLSKVLGFMREIVLVYFYGTSAYSDIYITAMNIPLVVLASIGGALVTTFIPLYHEALEEGGDKRALNFTNNIVCIIILISCILAILGYILAEPLVKLFAMNFTGEKLVLTVKFVRIMMAGVVCIGLSNIITAFLQIKGNFTIPGMIGLPNNIIIIISIIISATINNIYILPIGTLFGMLVQFLFQVPFAKKSGYKFELTINLNDKYLKKMLLLVIPVFIGIGVNQVNTMVDRSLASGLGDGVITALNSANKLNSFILGLFIATLGTVIYPTLSRLSSNSSKKEFTESLATSINCVNLLILPVTIGAIVLASPIVRVLFQRGEFDSRSTSLTATALIFYSIGMIGFGLRDILDKAFYALKDTRTPMVNGIISVILNIILNLILVNIMGYSGLALATSLSSIICIVLLLKSLKSKLGVSLQYKIKNTFFKSLLATIPMAIITYYSYKLLANRLGLGSLNEILVLGITIGIGTLVYFISIAILKVEEVNIIFNFIKNKLEKLEHI